MDKKIVVFDLDDTLYKEIDFLKSAYKEIALMLSEEKTELYEAIYISMLSAYYTKQNAFKKVLNEFCIKTHTISDLLNLYRRHKPNIKLDSETRVVLQSLKSMHIPIGIITDGRSIQQRNKLQALGVASYMSHIIISEEFGSEKPNPANYKYYHDFYKGHFFYIGDNPKKDFIAAKALGWTTICLLNKGDNIHPQNFNISSDYLPNYRITNIKQLLNIIKKS